jgi:hypothetical protein
MRNVTKFDKIREKGSTEYECNYQLNVRPTSTYLSSATLDNSSGLRSGLLNNYGFRGVNAPLQKTLNRGTNYGECSG